MTATMYPSRRADRIAPRPIGSARRTVRSGRADRVRPAEVDYTARRAVALVVVLVVVALAAFAGSALVGALADVGSRPAAASDIAATSANAPIVRIHVAQPGDTLWSIADRYRGEVGQRRFVDALIDVNGGTGIQVGQAVHLP